MKFQNKVLLAVAIVVFAAFLPACDNAKIEEANKLVTEGNKKTNEAKDLSTKAAASADKIFKPTEDDYKEYKAKNESAAKALMADYDKITDLFKAAAKDFTDASKTTPDAKFKEYYDTTASQLLKIGEVNTTSKEVAQAFLDSSDFDVFAKKLEEINKKLDGIQKQAKELSDKVDKLEAELKDKIKN